MSNNKQNNTTPITANDEKGLQSARNPPKMPTVKPPRAESGGKQ